MKTTFRSIYLLPVLFIFTLALNACGGGSTATGASRGQFIDAAVEGIVYTSGSRTGKTDANGNFIYETGKSVTFSIGGIVLGTISGSAIITPVQLIPNAVNQTDPAVTNIVQFLLTIDADQDETNGIQITNAIRAAAANLSLDFTLAGFDTDSNVSNVIGILTTAGLGNRALVSNAFAQSHLSDSLFAIMAGIYTGSFSGTDTGNWSVTVATDGTVIGTGNSNSNGAFSISGNVDSSGTASVTATGNAGTANWSGMIDITNGNFTGSWSGGADSGNFSGSKQ